MYDCYSEGYYQFCESDDLKNFKHIKNTLTQGNFTPRHGSVMHITKEETERLKSWSDLSLNRDKLNRIAIPNFTLKELEKRNDLIDQTNKVLTNSGNTKDFKSMNKKVEKFCKNY